MIVFHAKSRGDFSEALTSLQFGAFYDPGLDDDYVEVSFETEKLAIEFENWVKSHKKQH